MKLNIQLVANPTEEDLVKQSDEDLLDLWHKEACNMSYYNAAESPQWGIETPLREACKARFKLVNAEVEKRKLEKPKGSYLI